MIKEIINQIKKCLVFLFKLIVPIPIRAKSGTLAYSRPIDVFCYMTDVFQGLKREDEVKFKSCDERKVWVLLSRHSSEIFTVTLYYPYRISPDTIFDNKGIEIPALWNFEKLKKKRSISFLVGQRNVGSIPPFLDIIFRKLYECQENYNVSGRTILKSTYTTF